MQLLNKDFFARLKTAVDFYIIRHGQSEGNAGKILQGREEYPLSEKGKLQAVTRGRLLKNLVTEAAASAAASAEANAVPEKLLFFSSPQSRARETALIITEESGLPAPVFIDELIEMSLGIWSGKNWDQVKNDDPSLWAAFMAHSWDVIPEAETSDVLYKRALQTWAFLRDAAIERTAEKVFVVTHGGLIQWLLKSTMQCRSWFPLFPISNCGLFKLSVEPRPAEKSAYMCWEEINSTITELPEQPRGFPS